MIEAWPGSAERWERARNSLAGGVSTGLRAALKPHPLYLERGEEPRLFDVEGHTYLDHVLGWGPVIIGHAHPHLVDVVGRQLALGQTTGACHDLEYLVAERIIAAVPGTERLLWSNTGSEAAQAALRVARGCTGRQRFVKFHGHYHGWSDSMLVGYRPGADGRLAGGTRGQSAHAVEDVDLIPWNDLDAVRRVTTDPQRDIAAIFVEPVLCNSGVLLPDDGFLEGLRQIADETGALLVFDEVITGFRIAWGGAVARFEVRPDLVVLAKAIAGGMTLSAVAGKARYLDEVQRGIVHAGTYNGNPTALAGAAATLDVLSRPGIYEDLETRGAQLADGARDAFAAHGIAVTVNRIGSVVQTTPRAGDTHGLPAFFAADWEWYDRLSVELLRRGVFVMPGGRWYLSTVHTAADVAASVTALEESIGALADAGDLPRPD